MFAALHGDLNWLMRGVTRLVGSATGTYLMTFFVLVYLASEINTIHGTQFRKSLVKNMYRLLKT